MNDSKITYVTDVSFITCVVSVGRGDAVIKAAREMGATSALVYHARGIGPREQLGLLGIAIETEKEVIDILARPTMKTSSSKPYSGRGNSTCPVQGWLI